MRPGKVSSLVDVELCSLELKLVSVPEMGYHAKDLKGEVVVRGNGVFLGMYVSCAAKAAVIGYLKDEKKTKEAINEEGWLATGYYESLYITFML